MSLIWYIYSNDVVSGPFSTENVEQGFTEKKWPMESLIWWKGQREWISVETWRADLKNILETFRTNIQTTPWYVEHLGTQKGPMYSRDLQTFMQSNGIIGNCRIWTEGMDKWVNVYEVSELVQFFGISRRRHHRAPLKASLTIKIDEDTAITVQANSISEGGIGIRGLNNVKSGDTIYVYLKSPLLVKEVKASARVVYTLQNGFVGLEFTNLPKEDASMITDYVNQFRD